MIETVALTNLERLEGALNSAKGVMSQFEPSEDDNTFMRRPQLSHVLDILYSHSLVMENLMTSSRDMLSVKSDEPGFIVVEFNKMVVLLIISIKHIFWHKIYNRTILFSYS